MMLSISNIAWDNTQDETIYEYLNKSNYQAIEIAPSRLVAENPYDNTKIALEKIKHIKEKYNLNVSSMQSIWYGRNERIFGTKEERNILIDYTKKAVDYAAAIGCTNLVFGSPKNRTINSNDQMSIALEFFYNLGKIAYDSGVVIALEPNPEIYNTNFMNSTKETFDFIKKINSKGLLLNLDLGTVIWNNESLEDILLDINFINHIHISEPYLERIEKREMHLQLNNLLKKYNYSHYVSIEMKNPKDINIVMDTINYVKEVIR
ncbi:sugar phosphate isomerase/epimerase family protein [Anaerocolumna sp. MB42-C2]|uniref:sugar phosphate isomerase/epimerase family protein n=1 Tax=Anaerocolumna sp. MB42-C2 TaxID=3070997 RepID=UPI0027E1BF80|nr:sugar phosphate isomerase/epimerase family protein [Anaerocolumna sp. MB42-C2]WMJ89794.1 sugar phosphate isomerase/epimerase family protein [Anaerocolumna sp. MB42-C2]